MPMLMRASPSVASAGANAAMSRRSAVPRSSRSSACFSRGVTRDRAGERERTAAGFDRHVAHGHQAVRDLEHGQAAACATRTPAIAKSASSSVSDPVSPSSEARVMRRSSDAEARPSMLVSVAGLSHGANAFSVRPTTRSPREAGLACGQRSRRHSPARSGSRAAATPSRRCCRPASGRSASSRRASTRRRSRRASDPPIARQPCPIRRCRSSTWSVAVDSIDPASRLPRQLHRTGGGELFRHAERPADCQHLAELAVERRLPARGLEAAVPSRPDASRRPCRP